MDIFDRLIYFTKAENWGDPAKLNGMLLMMLDAVRGIVGHPFIIHCAYRAGEHEAQHGLGNAVDFHVLEITPKLAGLKLLEAFNDLQIADHLGFGCYPNWNNPGFHFDVRGTRARWGQSNGVYCGFDEAFKLMKG
jgi:uncharacterized protein YcbK (DUF882 family)